ncbi:unnamed protein product [Effrenium voratum]|nr:unnamed protein product [Effrenium voratum]|eukprot:CAMPEP_0181421764 /NCGR_PEP_ID=MMETSP1110-20121109/13264_1 /TAXON_ID=174948 /ORGANISM="Symbiodinium sp., Strain CCMP421" /LENGTH=446 /DNA_ID=CAMNT_0023544835 /DNA_START=26 /DNA_END=1366 /DNA_ORIENTATION=-
MATATVTVIGAESVQLSNPDRSPENECAKLSAIPDAEKMPAFKSLALMMYFAALSSINLVITIPTAHDYADRLGAGDLFAGLMIGLVPLCSIIGSVANTRLLSFLPMKTVWVVLCLGNVLGCILYALAGLMRFKWTLLGARGLMGLCSAFNIPGLYISLTVGTKRRSEVLFYYSAWLTLGCAAGPALAALLEVFMKFTKINNLVLDSDTIPGWFMAVVYLFFSVKVLIFLEEPTSLRGPEAAEPVRRVPLSWQQLAACCACFWHLSVGAAVNTGVEVYAVSVLQQVLGWNISASALFVAGLMLICGVFNLSLGRLLRLVPCSDSKGLVVGDALACLACVMLFNFDVHAVTAQISLMGLGLLAVLIFANLVRAFALSIATKVVPPSATKAVTTWAALAMSLGRGAGAVVGSVLNVDSFAPVLLCMFMGSLTVGLVARKYMKTEIKAS